MLDIKNPITITDKASIRYEQNLGSDVSGNQQEDPMVIINDEEYEIDNVTDIKSLSNYVKLSP